MIAGNQGQNIYPDPDNYPTTSFPQPVPPPLVDPDDEGTIITVQYSWQWREVLLAAVDQLINPATWLGDSDEIKLALNRATNLKDLLANPRYSDLAPYWDSENGSDLDGAPDEDDGSPWYYHIYEPSETFQENLEDWFIGAFVGAIAGASNAIVFLTLARKFRLQFKADPYGGIVDILLNSEHYASVDTYAPSPTIISYNVIAPDDLLTSLDVDDKIELMIRSTEDANPLATPTANGYTMSVVRKRLWEGELDAVIDVRTVGGQVEIMRDDGLGWVTVPNAEYVRRDGSLNPDVTGAFVVQPTTDTLAGAFRRASIAASAAILAAQTEAGANLFSVAANGNLTLSGTAQLINSANSEMTFQVAGAAILYVISNLVKTPKDFQITDNSSFAMRRRISGTPVDALKLVTGFDNSTLATFRASWMLSVSAATGDYAVVAGGVSTSNEARIGFLGVTPVTRQTVTGNDQGNLAFRSLMTALANLGLITDSTTHGTAYSFGVRQSETEPCILEYQESGGSWIEFADLTLCIPPPTGTKWDETCDCIMDTTDGGETWVETPLSDPRSSDVYRTIPPDDKCTSAASMVRYTRNMVSQVLQMIDASVLATDAVALIISVLITLGPFGVFALAVLAFWTLCVGTGSVVIAAAFTEDVWDLLLCIIYIHLEDDGSMTDAGLAAIYADIDALIGNADARAVLHAIYGIMGYVGLSNAGGLGLDTDYCGDCQCDNNDLTFTDGMFSPYSGRYTAAGTWIDGTGWRSTYDAGAGLNRIDIRKSCKVTGVNYLKFFVSADANSEFGVRVTRVDTGAEWMYTGIANSGTGTHFQVGPAQFINPGTGTPGTLTGEIYVELYSSTTGTTTIESLEIYT